MFANIKDEARVMAIIHFAYDVLNRHSKEKDLEVFKDKLLIYQFDLKYINKLDSLIKSLYINLI